MGTGSAIESKTDRETFFPGILRSDSRPQAPVPERFGTYRNLPTRRTQSGCLQWDRTGNAILAAWCAPVMLSDFSGADRIYIACGYTDLRRGIDGLAGIVQQQFRLDPFSNSLFLFCGRRRDRIKALYWEGNGFILLYKRLEAGVFQWPRSEAEARELTPQQYRWLMEGLQIDQPKAHRAIKNLSMF